MKLLNLGCGGRYHRAWTNIDIVAAGPGVIVYDLRKGIPVDTASYDAVYHSHMLEHMPKGDAEKFILECRRVLRPGGILRVVVPDLERIARGYLQALEKARKGKQEWRNHYEWMMLELFDQVVRTESGGEMARYLWKETIPNEDFILNRCGKEAQKLIAIGKERRINTPGGRSIFGLLPNPRKLIDMVLSRFGGNWYRMIKTGRFRLAGEIHQWMYDSYSLKNLLEHNGCTKVVERTATESAIENWKEYTLDADPDGTMYKPDSLYMEGIRE